MNYILGRSRCDYQRLGFFWRGEKEVQSGSERFFTTCLQRVNKF